MSQANRTLLLLSGLTAAAIGIGLYAYYGVQQPDVRAEKVKDRNERLFEPVKVDERSGDGGFAKAEFVKVTVSAKGETTSLEREPGKEWKLTAPVQAGADKLAIDQVISQLQQAKFKQVVEEQPDDAALVKYGLAPAQFVITAEALVGDAAERRTLKLEGGIENTYDGTVYLRREGDRQVWSAEGGVRWALAKTTFDLRTKVAFEIDEAKANKVEVKTKDNQYTLERDAQRAWRLVKPLAAAADQASLTGIFGALNDARALSFPPDRPETRKAFEPPLADATFTLEGGATVRVRFGKLDAQVLLLREEAGQALLVEVPASVAGQLDRNPNDLKDRLVLAFRKDQVARVIFRQADGVELIVERPASADGGTGEAWKVISPKAGPAKTFKLAAVLWTLGALKANVLGEENPKDWSRFGLDEKGRSVTLFGYDGKQLARLIIGKEVLGKQAVVYVRGTRSQVIEADNSRLAELPAKVEELLEAAVAADAGK